MAPNSIRVLQLNLERARAAHDIAWNDSIAHAVDLMIVSEPNEKICSTEGWSMDKKRTLQSGCVTGI